MEIRGRKSELMSEAISANDFSGDGVSASEHLAGSIKITGANRFPNARAADGLPVKGNGGKPVNLEANFCAELFQQFHVAAALVAKDKIRADADALDFPEVLSQSANERFATLLAEFFVEVNHQ